MKKLFPLLTALVLAACGTTNGNLKYIASAERPSLASRSTQTVIVGNFDDQRDGDKKWLGVIRGGFGNHLKTLEAERPVNEIVRDAFADGLRIRNVALSERAAPRLSGRIITLYADQVIRREGNAEIEVTVVDATGAVRLKKAYKTTRIEGSMLSMSTGVMASVEDLRAVLERTLSETVDKALDDPELRSALGI